MEKIFLIKKNNFIVRLYKKMKNTFFLIFDFNKKKFCFRI
jgi:hypothetical protein